MQKYFITCFLLAFVTVTQIRATSARKRKERDHSQTDNVTIASLLNRLDNKSDQEDSSYVSMRMFSDDNVEFKKGNITVLVPRSQINGRRKCRSKRCRRRKGDGAPMHSISHAQLQSTARNAMLNLSSRSNTMVIMRANDLKKDWCRTARMKRKIRQKGCWPKTVVNNFCYGQCNSFFIPRQILEKRSLENFQSCAHCQPTSVRWVSVTMHCPRLIPPIRKKRILRVDKCSCSTGTPTTF